MPDEQPTHAADPSNEGGEHGGDGSSTAGQPPAADPAAQEATLKELNRIHGRTFGSLDEAQKHVAHLNSLVGNPRLREDAQLMDTFTKQYASEKGISVDEARKEIETQLKSQPTAPAANTTHSMSPADATRLERLERNEFLRGHPEAAEHIDKIAKYAKSNDMEYEAAFNELYGDVFRKIDETRKAEDTRRTKIGAQVSASESVPEAPAGSQEKKALDEYSKTGNSKFLREAIKLREARTAKQNA